MYNNKNYKNYNSWDRDDDYSYSRNYKNQSNYYRTSNAGFNSGFNTTRKTYSHNYSWDWSSYVPFKSLTEEESNQYLFVKEHLGYLTPDVSIVKSRFNQFISDDTISLVKDLSRMFYYQLLDEENCLKPETEIDPSKLEKYNQFIQIKDKFFNNTEIPGFTPLEKAVNVIKVLTEDNKQDIGSLSQKQLEKRLDDFHLKDDVFRDSDIEAQMGKLDPRFKNKFSKLNKISLIENFGSKFKVQKEVEEKIVQNSPIIAIKRMLSIEQITNVDLYQRLLPNFNLKLALKDLNVKVPIDKTEHKQKIIILLDESGLLTI